jgi:predicted lipoprotein with Yx(FWY)xxD motif
VIIPTAIPAWPKSPQNLPISTAAGDKFGPKICTDGKGGAIIVWKDTRNGIGDIYVQRVDNIGMLQWTPNGMPICAAPYDQGSPQLVPDGMGGAIIVWMDFRNGTDNDIYAQRVSSDGQVQWATNGVPVCMAADNQQNPLLVSDGAGGAIVIWEDLRNGLYDIYAQRIDSSGSPLWTSDGAAIVTATGNQGGPRLVSDGTGGAIMVWADGRSGTDYHIYAQRIDGSGALQWAADGIPICTASFGQTNPEIASDGVGGAIMVWEDGRSGIENNVYAQRVNDSGIVQWTSDGVAICTAANNQYLPTVAPDGVGGAIITWWDYRSGTQFDINAQRVSGAGSVQWTADGVPISIPGGQAPPTIISDGSGGAIIVWYDDRNGMDSDVLAQRINSAGVPQWMVNGMGISTAVGDQVRPQITSDGAGGAIIVWEDYRAIRGDIYAQWISASGLE